MKFLLDTHTFLWWVTDDVRLSQDVRILIADGRKELYLSVPAVGKLPSRRN